jgi:PAS domain S-box-containing protein
MTSEDRARDKGVSASADDLGDAVDPSFRSVAESLTDNIMLLDPEGHVRYTNNTVPDLTIEQVLGTSVYRYVPEEYREVMRRCHGRVLATGQPDRYDTAYVSEAGEVSWWETRVSPVQRDGRVVALVQIASNVTERRMAAADRDRLFNLSIDMLCVAGTDGYFKRINPAFGHTLGYSDEELLAQPFLAFVHPEDRERTQAAVARLASGELVIDFDNRYRCQDGSYRWLSWRAAPDATGKLIHAIGRDVTEPRRLEQQLRHSQKMEAVGRLAGGIAHDFNNLLLAIDLNVDLMTKTPDPVKREQFSAEARRATQRAADLTRQLLALGRRSHTAFEPIDLNATVEGMLTLLRRLIAENIEVAFEPAQGMPAVRADAGQIEQVVLNLCLNARDAMPEGGRLSILTRLVPADDDRERAGGAAVGDRVALCVTDTGIGMSAEVRERAFEPFFTTKGLGKGTGLGLAMVYAIVAQHGGSVRVESEPGRGSSFEVLLPAATEPVAGAIERPKSQVLGGCETILVAEDEPSVRDAVLGLLQGAGYRVLIATNGEEAVSLFEQHIAVVALAVLDVVMPRLGGPSAALRIRKLSPELPVILTSGYADAVEVGVSSVPHALRIDKPYASEALLQLVRQALDRA